MISSTRPLFQSSWLRVLPLTLGFSLLAQAYPPDWWYSGSPPVINGAATPSNASPATIGQAKWMAFRALATLDTINSGLATQIRTDLTGTGKAVPNWDPPGPADVDAQKAPLLLGQLKALAAPFYERINAITPDWLANEKRINGTYTDDGIYPWTATTADDANMAIATIGQLKAVFALHFTEQDPSDGVDDLSPSFATLVTAATNPSSSAVHVPEIIDTNHDGLNDPWQVANHVTGGPYDDDDGDGFSNLAEQQAGTDPESATSFPPTLKYVGLNVYAFSSTSGTDTPLKGTQVIPWNDPNTADNETSTGTLSPGDMESFRDGQPMPATLTAAMAGGPNPAYVLDGGLQVTTDGWANYDSSTWDDGSEDVAGYHWTRAWMHLPPWTTAQKATLLRLTDHETTGAATVISGEKVDVTISANASDSGPIDIRPNATKIPNGSDRLYQRLLYLPSCDTIYLLSGKPTDCVVLAQGSTLPCQWGLKDPDPAKVVGTFSNAATVACTFTGTHPGTNTIQLKINGSVVWEKDVEVLNVIGRNVWHAATPLPGIRRLPTINAITVHHLDGVLDGASGVLDTQTEHMTKRGFSDIAYHFLIDREGVYYEGRQLEGYFTDGSFSEGSHVLNNNPAAGIGVCMMADYEGHAAVAAKPAQNGKPAVAAQDQKDPETFTDARKLALEKLLAALARRYQVTTDRITYHQAMATDNPTACPGPAVITAFPTVVHDVRTELR